MTEKAPEVLGQGGYSVLPFGYTGHGGTFPYMDIGLSFAMKNTDNTRNTANSVAQSEVVPSSPLKGVEANEKKIVEPGIMGPTCVSSTAHFNSKEGGGNVQRVSGGAQRVGTGGFRSEPWTSPNSPLRATPSARADDLLQNIGSLEFDKLRVHVDLDPALDEQKIRNRYSSEIARLSPASRDLLETKKLVAVPSNSKVDISLTPPLSCNLANVICECPLMLLNTMSTEYQLILKNDKRTIGALNQIF